MPPGCRYRCTVRLPIRTGASQGCRRHSWVRVGTRRVVTAATSYEHSAAAIQRMRCSAGYQMLPGDRAVNPVLGYAVELLDAFHPGLRRRPEIPVLGEAGDRAEPVDRADAGHQGLHAVHELDFAGPVLGAVTEDGQRVHHGLLPCGDGTGLRGSRGRGGVAEEALGKQRLVEVAAPRPASPLGAVGADAQRPA